MSVPDAISLARAKSYVGIPAGITQHDTFLGYLISSITEHVATRLGLTAGLTVNTYTEILDVEDYGEDQLRVSAYPLVAIESLTDAGTALSPESYYVHRSRRWVRLTDHLSCFTQGRRKVQVSYSAGWASIPETILHAVTVSVGHHFNRLPKSGLETERIGAYSITLAQGDAALCQEAEALLAEHVSPVVMR